MTRYIAGRRGFTLVEVTLALGIVAFALVALMGLFVAGLRSEKDSSYYIRVGNLATRMITERRDNPLQASPNPAASDRPFLLPPLDAPEMLDNGVPQTPSGSVVYFSGNERVVSSVGDAAMACRASTTLGSNSEMAYLSLEFFWPAAGLANGASPNYRVATAVRLQP